MRSTQCAGARMTRVSRQPGGGRFSLRASVLLGAVEGASCPSPDVQSPRGPAGLSRQNLRCSVRQTAVKHVTA